MKRISEFSKVPRQHIYQIVSTLYELGLVKKALTLPNSFIAISIPEALSILMKRKRKEYNEIRAKATTMLKNFVKNPTKAKSEEEEPQFILIAGKDATDCWVRKQIEDTKTSIDALIPMEVSVGVMQSYAGILKEALKRGVEIRHITQKLEDEKSVLLITEFLRKFSNFKIRYILARPHTAVTLWDKKKVFIGSVPVDPISAPGLLLNNPAFVATIKEYFELIWSKAQE